MAKSSRSSKNFDAFSAVKNAITAPIEVVGSTLSTTSGGTTSSLSNINHGLSYPEFNPNNYIAPDLFTDSSSLPRTDDATTAEALLSIHEKENTVKIADANIKLNTAVVGAGISYQKFLGKVVDYGTAQIDVQTRMRHYDIANINLAIADTKLQVAQEKLTQEQIVLEGTQALTPLIREEWDQKKALKQARIDGLKHQVALAGSKLDEAIKALNAA